MNFLSHFYLHNDPEDNFFTVGLTLPDLLGFHSKRIRLTKNFINKAYSIERDKDLKSLLLGSYLHILIDRWFHNTNFFKEKLIFLQDKFTEYNKNENRLPNFFAHILLEILIDRYLLKIEPDIADRFYMSYKTFNFIKALPILTRLKNFEKEKFLSLAENVSYSSFLKDYSYNNRIITILKRVCRRINIPFELDTSDDEFEKYIQDSYNNLEPIIINFMSHTKKSFEIKQKEKIIQDLVLEKLSS